MSEQVPDTRPGRATTQFFVLSIFFWAAVLVATLLWGPVYRWMGHYISMTSEYSLLEQGTKFFLLIMMIAAVLAYRNEKDRTRVVLGILFFLFALAAYFSESNFIDNVWQPVFGAVFILAMIWQLLKTGHIALLFIFLGSVSIVAGMLGDVWHDHPEVLPDWAPLYELGRRAFALEEYMDLWGIALFTYASLIVFRDPLEEALRNHRPGMVWLVVSAVLLASGNGFAHWQIHYGPTMTIVATALAFLGFLGVVYAGEKLLTGGIRFGFFSKGIFYNGIILLFLILPIIFCGVSPGLNLAIWVYFFTLAGRYLYKSNPLLGGRLL